MRILFFAHCRAEIGTDKEHAMSKGDIAMPLAIQDWDGEMQATPMRS